VYFDSVWVFMVLRDKRVVGVFVPFFVRRFTKRTRLQSILRY
jgi:hypothetical protein